MPRSTLQRELLLDLWDDEIAYAYAYRHQQKINDHLDRLSRIAMLIEQRALHDANLCSLPSANKRLPRIVCGVLNKLRAIVHDGANLTESEVRTWSRSPTAFHHDDFVFHCLHEKTPAISKLVLDIRALFEKVIPFSIKSTITIQQFEKIIAPIIGKYDEIVPIHFPSLTYSIHTELIFQNELSLNKEGGREIMGRILGGYGRSAYQEYFRAVEDEFFRLIAPTLLPEAEVLDISIDRYYPWGALQCPPRPVKHMLADLSGLINQDREWFVKWEKPNARQGCPDLTSQKFTFQQLSSVPRIVPRSSTGQIYFSSERCELTVNGVPLLNQLALILPYDRPYRELDQSIERFKKYFLRRSAEYQQEMLGDVERDRALTAREQSMIRERKVDRVILKTVSSVVTHLAALRALEPDCPFDPRKPATSLYLNIHEEFRQFGFDHGREVYKAAVRSKNRHSDAVVKTLRSWVPPMNQAERHRVV